MSLKHPPPPSPTEAKIQAHLEGNPDTAMLGHMAKELEMVTMGWVRRKIHPDVQAAAATTHLVAILTAMKVARVVPPDFIDTLAQDVTSSVVGRAQPGVDEWLTTQ